jgi:hypothetical protein
MILKSGWVERATSNEFALIYDHEAGYVILGVVEEDGHRRWDLAKGRGPRSRIVSERPFQTMFEALQAAEEMMAEDHQLAATGGRRELLQAC